MGKLRDLILLGSDRQALSYIKRYVGGGGSSSTQELTPLSTEEWDGDNVFTTLTANTALTLNTTKNAGVIYIVDNNSYTLSVNGTNIPINATTPTLIGYIKIGDEYIFSVELSPIISTYTPPTTTTTTAPVVSEYVTWNDIASTQYEQYNLNRGIRKYTSTGAGSVYTVESIADGEVFDIKIDNVAAHQLKVWLASTQAEAVTSARAAVKLNTNWTANPFDSATYAYFTIAGAVGDVIRIGINNGKFIVLLSKDNGTTFVSLAAHKNLPTSVSYFLGLNDNVNGYGALEVSKVVENLLAYPYNFKTLAQAGNTSIQTSWDAVVGATGYELQRASNILFTTGLTTVYTGTNLSFLDTGLTNSTLYYYRVRALGTKNSPYYINSATTSSTGEPAVLSFAVTGTRNEPTADYRGLRRTLNFVTGDSILSWSNETIGIGEALVYRMGSTGTDVFNARFTNNLGVSNYLNIVQNNTFNVQEGGVNQSTGNAIASGNYIRFAYNANNTITIDKSIDSGASWTTVYTSGLVPSGNYYMGLDGTFTITLTYKMTL